MGCMVGGAKVVIDENDGSCKENFCLDAFAFDPKEGWLVPVRDIPGLSGYKPRPIMVTLEGKVYVLSRHSYYSYLFELDLEAPHFEVFDPNPVDGGDRNWEILPNPLSFTKSGGYTILDYFAWGQRLGIYTQKKEGFWAILFGMDRDYIQLGEIFHALWQNYPHYFLHDTWVEDSRSRHHDGIRATNHNFHHMPNNGHISVPNEPRYYNVHNARPISNLLGGADASNFYNHRLIPSSNTTSHYAPQSYGVSSMEAVHNHNHHHLVRGSYTDFHFQPATHYSVEHVVYPESASFSHWNNSELDPHQPLPHMQAMRGNNLDLQPQVPSSSNRHQTNNNPQQHYASNSSRDSIDDGYRNFRPSNSIVPIDRFTIELVDGVILLEDEEDMAYEEVLDLEEQMGHINTGLSEETITRNLKVRAHISSVRQSLDQEPEICTICQGEYENNDTIGSLECRHDYHAVCIKKWLQEKNVCPLCKSTALTIKS